jgi:hypothetical protein
LKISMNEFRVIVHTQRASRHKNWNHTFKGGKKKTYVDGSGGSIYASTDSPSISNDLLSTNC